MRVEKECEYRRSASREGVLVRRSARKEGVRAEKKKVEKECE